MFFKNKKNLFLFFTLLIFFILIILSIIFFEIFNNKEASLIILLFSNLLLFIIFIVSLFTENIKNKIRIFNNTINQIPDFINELNSNEKSGFLIYDDKNVITFISKFLLENGFKDLIGEKLSFLKINFKDKSDFETIEKRKIFGKYYKIIRNKSKNQISFMEIEENINLINQLENSLNALIIIEIFYSNTLSKDEIKLFEIQLLINKFLKEWVKKNNAIIKSDSSIDKKITIIVNWNLIKKEIINESFINEFLKIIKNNKKEISISIGLSIGNRNFYLMEINSNKALELSKNRGGNQIVVIDENNKIIIVGNSSQQYKDTSKVEVKMFYNKVFSKIEKMTDIYITSHQSVDIDGLSSCLAFAKLIKSFNKEEVKIVLDSFDETSKKAFKKLNFEDKLLFIEEKEALEKYTINSSIFVLDVSIISRTQAPNLISKINEENRYLIDHHRIGSDTLDFHHENTYVSINSSSVAEIVSEMIMFRTQENEREFINNSNLSLLVSGIYIDTNNLTRNISQTTYDALSFLSKSGANIDYSFNYSKKSLEYYKIFSEFINSMVVYENLVYTFLPENIETEDNEISYTSDQLLNLEGIEASFVFGKTKGGFFKLSARSNDNVNVQKICEKLGGGGHFSSSAAAWKVGKIKYKQLKKKIKDEIIKNFDESKID